MDKAVLPASATAAPVRAGRAIVLLSDGTGNSAAKLAKTNVWRLYQSLALEAPRVGEAPRQLAYYDDGVGTSAFKPLALLGGAFGIGLKRNVLDLYKFLCRNYRPGDRIYAFGFSRGAFTIRLLVGLVAELGVVDADTDEDLERHAADAYRRFRGCFKQTGGLVGPLRWLRDRVIAAKREASGLPGFDEVARTEVPAIELVGVWDTVAAYGMPISELTRGIDNWVWPLSMPDYVLSPKVRTARHALALDDERDTFHPLLWDEVAERDLARQGLVKEGRIQQVWFAGMHADVGGGYADDSMSEVPLLWMMEAAAEAGLEFMPHELEHLRMSCRRHGPMHDSRQGLGGYYRYQPRRIGARLERPDRESSIMQDPGLQDGTGAVRGLLTSVTLHESVLDRIRAGNDRYAPIVLPGRYRVASGGELLEPEELGVADRIRAARQEHVWDVVWQRRVFYFATVLCSALLVAMPLIQHALDVRGCSGLGCDTISPAVRLAEGYIPDIVPFTDPGRWIDAFANAPILSLTLAVLLVGGLIRGTILQRRIRDRMRAVWSGASKATPAEAGEANASYSAGPPSGWIYSLRTSAAYQGAFRWLKWKAIPFVFGTGILCAGFMGAVWAVPRLAEAVTGLAIAGPAPETALAVGAALTGLLVLGELLTRRLAGVRERASPAGPVAVDAETGRAVVVPAE
ncbi:MAG TPA: DUF2235 domain-containing protein [Geminicoccaceae bacterium]|nr:DUF2235 domain-containing protein [Geminicoccus sp.]HMU52262.1 DUF2235 domain-containing protein [Geminicoccaceae bacterium]